MLQQLKAIVLHSIKYGESGIIIQTYTDKYGRQSFIIHGVRKRNAKISAYLFNPLNVLDLMAYYKTGRELHQIKEIRSGLNSGNLHFDIRHSAISVFLGEVLNRSIREVEPNPGLYAYLEGAIQMLSVCKEGIQNFHLVFLIQLTKFLGIYPRNHAELDRYAGNSDLHLDSLLDYSLSELPDINLGNEDRSELLKQILQFYKDHIDGFGQLKSLDILHEVFH